MSVWRIRNSCPRDKVDRSISVYYTFVCRSSAFTSDCSSPPTFNRIDSFNWSIAAKFYFRRNKLPVPNLIEDVLLPILGQGQSGTRIDVVPVQSARWCTRVLHLIVPRSQLRQPWNELQRPGWVLFLPGACRERTQTNGNVLQKPAIVRCGAHCRCGRKEVGWISKQNPHIGLLNRSNTYTVR